jgi:hypothetical protein
MAPTTEPPLRETFDYVQVDLSQMLKSMLRFAAWKHEV